MKDDLDNYFSASSPFRHSARTADQRSTDYYKRKTCQGDLENLVLILQESAAAMGLNKPMPHGYKDKIEYYLERIERKIEISASPKGNGELLKQAKWEFFQKTDPMGTIRVLKKMKILKKGE